ncbi:MAG: hypothetical protein M1401_08460 [Chloroflexi bacterium]|nr:hypothetical protein [Chloroflexota bacterium]MCL5108878.1 hypothetical protein [Chloroflexota bacterium]
MGNCADDGLSVHDLEGELAELARRRAELVRERGLFRRLGFSQERLNLALRQVDRRQSRCQELLQRRQGDRRSAEGRLNGAPMGTPHPG